MQVNRIQSFQQIWNLLRRTPITTRTELVRDSGLSKATVSEAVSLMIQHGVVAEVGKRNPGRGRRQVVLELQAGTRMVIGAQFTETGCHAVLADLSASPVSFADRSVTSNDPASLIRALGECIAELRGQTEAPILGLGLGVPGLVSADGRKVVLSVPFGWENVPICDMIERELDISVITINRAKSAALGEYWQGAAYKESDREHLAHVHVGAGIVAGFVYGGQLLMGHGGAAGELGHVTMVPDGPTCACGNQGCLHMFASESAILRDVQTRRQRQPGGSFSIETFEDVRTALESGDTVTTEVVQDAGKWVGIAIANVINVMNPSTVTIAGSVADLGDVFMDRVRQEVGRRAMWEVMQGVTIAKSVLGDNGGTIGGAALFIDTIGIERVLA